MLTRSALLAWTLAASSLASHGAHPVSPDLASALVDAALANPLVATDAGIRTTLALEVALVWLEGHNDLNPKGYNDGGASACAFQVYLVHGARTAEGWTADELRHDARKCATVGVRLIKASVERGPRDCELCLYARGRDTAEARRLSAHRVGLAKRLIHEVRLEAE